MRRILSFFFTAVLIISTLCTSCIKNIEEEGIYVTTHCFGTLLNEQTTQPIQGMRVVTTDGSIIDETVYSDADGMFSIDVTVEQLRRGCYISILPDSLYQIQDVKLDEMPLGIENYNLGTIWIEGPSAPMVSTDDVSNITSKSAHCYGSIMEDGYSTITERGFVYDIVQYPTVENRKVIIETGALNYDVQLNLSPNTTYYVRAYARNGLGIGYGEQIEFTTLSGLPDVSTLNITNITSTSAVCVAYYDADNNYPVTTCGVCWSTSPNPNVNNLHTSMAANYNNYECSLSNLQPNTTYYVRAYAGCSLGFGYGEQLTFTTQNGLPTVTTTAVTNITASSATAGGIVTDDGGFPVTKRGICYSTSPYPQVTDMHTTDGTGLGGFVSNLTGLASGTTYYYRAYATNAVGTVYGEQSVFVTH